MFPESIRALGQFIPMTHVVSLLQGLWFGEPWRSHLAATVVLGGLLVAGVLFSALTFRWE
jgi:ABC-2 type transport system permease protein